MRVMVRAVVASLIALALWISGGFGGGGDVQAQQPTQPVIDLTVETQAGESFPFTVELLTTYRQRAMGMMFRKELARDAGMIFVFPEEAPRAFWMRNTLVPLDIIFADAEGRIVNIVAAKPLDETPLPSDGPAQFVLEVNRGVAQALGFGPGDRLVSPEMFAAVGRAE